MGGGEEDASKYKTQGGSSKFFVRTWYIYLPNLQIDLL